MISDRSIEFVGCSIRDEVERKLGELVYGISFRGSVKTQ